MAYTEGMFYYFVWVRSSRYHGSEPLTYAHDKKLATGSIVQVEMQKELVLGVVSGPTSQPRFQTKAIAKVFDLPPIPAHLLKLAAWLKAYYPAPLGIITQQLIPASLTQKQLTSSTATQDIAGYDLAMLPPLTDEQQTALAAMAERNSYLLHGTTGSGKTRLYIELAARAIANGKSAIILTPEISLTTQLASSFQQVFGKRVIVMHSQQAPSERRSAWLTSLRAREPIIIIGPRSALFCPIQKLGLIVLDEAHEAAYKQEQAPQYQTGRVAAYLASLTRASLVLGSATPGISDYYLAEQKRKPVITLTRLARDSTTVIPSQNVLAGRFVDSSEASISETSSDHDHSSEIAEESRSIKSPKSQAKVNEISPAGRDDGGELGSSGKLEVSVIDRKDHSLFSRSPFMGLELIKSVETALARGEQSLLYLNRRGTARMVLCENCGWQATCPHCDVPLTYHGDTHRLRCHSCNYHTPAPSSCPDCGHASIIYKTAGTKAIVEEAERLFPNARIARFDTDNLKAERFEQHYEAVKNGEVDILVGTQLLAKGLDLPKLSTLGILLADTSLYLPDFSAQERTFQLITQVLGRIGRGHVAGKAIIQTYHPEHPVLRDAIEVDYQRFYERELAERKRFLFPPYCYMLKLTVRRASLKAAESAAEKLKSELQSGAYHVRVEGPAPSFYERFQNKYQWQLVIKATQRSELLKIIANLPANWSYDIDPIDLL